jgi:hypothetical protein
MGDGETFALAPENYNPEILAALDRSLPHLPEQPGWGVALDKPAGEYTLDLMVGSTLHGCAAGHASLPTRFAVLAAVGLVATATADAGR